MSSAKNLLSALMLGGSSSPASPASTAKAKKRQRVKPTTTKNNSSNGDKLKKPPPPPPPLAAAGVDSKEVNGFGKVAESQLIVIDSEESDAAFHFPSTTAMTSSPGELPIPDDQVWMETVVAHFSRCASGENIHETSYFRNKVHTTTHSSTRISAAASSSSSVGGRTFCLRRLLQELASLDKDLPSNPAIWLRFDEEIPQYMRALVTAPCNTPYSFGLFCFDIYIPDSYPSVPPKIQLLTTGNNTVNFGPNLYSNGKVCLSLLNTWDGPKWNPQHSSLMQCLVSLQALILGVEHPYYLEPGRGGWEGHISGSTDALMEKTASNLATKAAKLLAATSNNSMKNNNTKFAAKMSQQSKKSSTGGGGGNATSNVATATSVSSTASKIAASTTTKQKIIPSRVQSYEDKIRMGTVQFAMLDMVKSLQGGSRHKYLIPFADIIRSHFCHYKDRMIQETRMWGNLMKSGPAAYMHRSFMQGVESLTIELEKLQPLLPATPAAAASAAGNATTAQDGIEGLEAIVAAKQRAIQEAVAKEDYVTAGRLQLDLRHSEQFGSIDSKILVKRQEMEVAARKGDYITAGQLQSSLQHLESNKKMLQDVERRMLDAASKLDFVRAGNFQEQYKVLLGIGDNNVSSSSLSATKASSAYPTPMDVSAGGPPPPPPPPFYGGPPPMGVPVYMGSGPPPFMPPPLHAPIGGGFAMEDPYAYDDYGDY